jgi:hypothetical protein
MRWRDVRRGRRTVRGRRAEGRVELAVSDQGVGLPDRFSPAQALPASETVGFLSVPP